MEAGAVARSRSWPRSIRIRALRTCLAGIVATSLAAGCARLPADDSAEAGFARDMATHHAQAAEMAFVVRDVSRDTRLRALAYDIIVTQSSQRGMFMGWLQQWGLPQTSSSPRMAWMPMPQHSPAMHAGMGGALMPGMATDIELARLREATGTEAEILFLQLMIRHHEGGVHMARGVLMHSTRDEVVSMARSIDSGQTVEITLMTEMLAERGAKPYPSILQ